MAISPIWPADTARNSNGELTFHGITASTLLDEFGSPLYVLDLDEVRARASHFVKAAAHAFTNNTTHVSYAAKAFLSKEMARIVTEEGMFVDTCTLGEMKIALAAGVPGRRLVLHGNNKSDEEIELAIAEGFSKIVIDSPDEPARIAAIAERLGKRARVMLRVTSGIHAGGHEYVSTAHEDQKFGVALLPAGADTEIVDNIDQLQDVSPAATNALVHETELEQGGETKQQADRQLRYDVRYPYDLNAADVTEGDRLLAAAMELVANGPAIAVLREIAKYGNLELVGVHSHIGSNIHDAEAFIQAAKRMMLLRKTFYATNAYTLPRGRSRRWLFGRLHRRRGPYGRGPRTRPSRRRRVEDEPLARHARADHLVRAGPLDRRPRRRDALPCGHREDRAAWRRLHEQRGRADSRTRVHLGGRRHERQHSPGALRREIHRDSCQSRVR
ncbi:diaminopimelate decarboxylase [Bifidobacterium animalis subsp. animalis]|nr:diaminopimelate decarboxylase [Bifidobacterium animalis subsp. animalis]